ncbi:flagellar basal body rod protein FlgB [Clostridium carnis]
MNINTDNTYRLIKQGLDISALREKVISNNMANVNTKGFKKSYVSFDESFSNAKEVFSLKRTKEQHIKGNDDSNSVLIKKDDSTSMRMDGNNVNIDLEKVDQAANSLMYNALITQANSKMSMTKNVISGGGR